VEVLQMNIGRLTLRELSKFESAENMTDITLRRRDIYIKEVLPVLKRWRQLRRLTLVDLVKPETETIPPFEVLSGFIMGMKHLSHLHINIRQSAHSNGQWKILRDKVNELILPRRPNFKLDISRR
jgi:hypothetical protein